MHTQFHEILEHVQRGASAAYSFDAEGTQYVRSFRPAERLILLGCGHIAQPLCQYATDLGFSVIAVDDRPSFANRTRFPDAAQIVCDSFSEAIKSLQIGQNDYVAVITRGHRYDADCLRAILPGPAPKYLGMIGSRRRVVALLNLLEGEGFPRSALDDIHTPIGLDIGALTVKEIAISIVAELIACRRQRTNRRAKGTVLVAEDIVLSLLRFLVCDPAPKALLTVYATSGSTPVKSGAMMAVDRTLRSAGTIGGGCGESAVLRDACRLIGSGDKRCVTVDMSNDVAEEEGMVCGGQMKVLIEDLDAADGILGELEAEK